MGKKSRVMIYLVAILLICLAPFWAANYILNHRQNLSLHQNIHGFLYHPPRDITGFASFKYQSGAHHWSLLYVTQGCCISEACRNNAYNLRASRGILVKDEHLFKSYIAMPEHCKRDGVSQEIFKDDSVHRIYFNGDELKQLQAQVYQVEEAIDWASDQLFIVDPFQKVVLHYPGDGAPTRWLQDFKLLLKVGFNE